ncbi:polyphosphate kinase 2 family protein [Rudanella paleaurantiibacter]|uniref:Polyphosphate kinase 2 family protein n=1 Tax=Rudanella paleaurantiibacter TaxID=2614655 RepID=A0A7J5U069_9BACT|nr:PPK2 family polyphosphate kinase [Rudanella paleaurantiibacter]KAB7730921.1 polyphosphate kinase 2 family protein [Rudanella paleaurantiibacter]
MKKFSSKPFRFDGRTPYSAKHTPTRIDPLFRDEDDRAHQLDALSDRMDQAQNQMHAHEKYGFVVLFQAMDAGGKDSSIRHVFKGVNPSRFQVAAFKKPGKEDLAHDFMWRFWKKLPERGYIGIFNRTYYEEVLALKVHPDRLADNSIPEEFLKNPGKLWKERYADITHFEDYLHRNGFRVVKFYLHVSKEEQGQRLINRLKDTEKQWKLSENDLEERQEWDAYMQAYEDAINATATRNCPWYVIPSDDMNNQQLIIAHIMAELLESLPVHFPQRNEKEAQKLIKQIEKQDKA